jgi:hypothetical protein
MQDNQQNNTYSILVFDDGNEKYKDLPNTWEIEKSLNGKCTIKNKKENITINSISEWKLLEITGYVET